MRAATARSGSGLRAAWVKLWTRCGCNGVRITKKGRGFTPRPRETWNQAHRPVQYGLPVHTDANPRHARREHLADVVGNRRVLLPLQREDRVAIPHVEDVQRGNEPQSADLDRTLDVEVDVLVGGEAIVAHRIEQDGGDAGAVQTRRRVDVRLEQIALPRVVERRYVHL